jgi:hypothetical protein
VYMRDGGEMNSRGLYLDLPPWGYHVFELSTLNSDMSTQDSASTFPPHQ